VKIGAITYEVVQVARPPIVDRRECTGSIDYEQARIELLNDRCQGQMEQTLWHEILHGIACDRDIDGLFGQCDDDHERWLDALAAGLHAFVVDNGLKFPTQG